MLNIFRYFRRSETSDASSTTEIKQNEVPIDTFNPEIATALESDWPVQMEEVFLLPPGLSEEFESICDGDISAYDDATLYCPPRWAYTIRDLDTYSRVVES